jgi:hypothetical protein
VVQPSPQPQCIELIDGKHPHTTLRTPGTADHPVTASARHIGECRIHDLDKLPVLRNWKSIPHISRIVAESPARHSLERKGS